MKKNFHICDVMALAVAARKYTTFLNKIRGIEEAIRHTSSISDLRRLINTRQAYEKKAARIRRHLDGVSI